MKANKKLIFLSALMLSCLVPIFGKKEDKITTILKSLYSQEDYGESLGQGAHGKILGSKNTNDVIKATTKINSRNKEFDKQLKAYKALEKHDPENILRQRATFLKPKNLIITEDICFFHMERLYPLFPGTKKLTRVYLKETQLDKANCKGYEQIEMLINSYPYVSDNKTNMEQLCYDLGALFAILYFEAQLTDCDTEVFLVKKSKESDGYKIVLLDFALTQDISSNFQAKNTAALIKKMVQSLTNNKHTPSFTSQGFTFFSLGFLDFALKHSQEAFQIATNVIENCIAITV